MAARRGRSSFAGPLHGRGVRRLRRLGETNANASQSRPAKIFHFTEIRICRMCRPSRPTRGAIVRRHDRGSGLRWTRAALKASLCGQGEMNLVSCTNRIDGRRPCLRISCGAGPCPAKPWRSGSLRTAKPCGPGRRCYGQAFAKMRIALNRRGARAISRRRRRQEGTRLRGEHGISRQTIAQGRPSVRLHLYLRCAVCVCNHSRSGSRVPAGTRSSLRPFFSRG